MNRAVVNAVNILPRENTKFTFTFVYIYYPRNVNNINIK